MLIDDNNFVRSCLTYPSDLIKFYHSLNNDKPPLWQKLKMAAHAKSFRPKNQVYRNLPLIRGISFDCKLNLDFFDT